MSSQNASETVIDVRQIVPQMRHALIFSTFEQLPAGGSFLLVNDHDPKPLHYQFGMRHPGEFDWNYEEAGPEIWRVRISRAA